LRAGSSGSSPQSGSPTSSRIAPRALSSRPSRSRATNERGASPSRPKREGGHAMRIACAMSAQPGGRGSVRCETMRCTARDVAACGIWMSQESEKRSPERRRREREKDDLIARLRREAAGRDAELGGLRERLDVAEHELEDLRAIRDALTPFELPVRPGLELAALFLPAAEERVSGDFYLVAAGPQDSTVLVVGDVVGHGLRAAQRAAFIRTTFAATAPFSDDPCRLRSWANTALIERAGTSVDLVTAACVTSLAS